MSNTAPNHKSVSKLCVVRRTFEHLLAEQPIPSSAVLLEALKPMELRMLQRGLVSPPRDGNSALWFLGETERNLFLWRNGLSLDDSPEFDFWIDVPKLITKRCSGSSTPENLTVAPHQSDLALNELLAHTLGGNRDYLRQLHEQFIKIQLHLHALSQATAELKSEALRELGKRSPVPVVLPAVNAPRRLEE